MDLANEDRYVCMPLKDITLSDNYRYKLVVITLNTHHQYDKARLVSTYVNPSNALDCDYSIQVLDQNGTNTLVLNRKDYSNSWWLYKQVVT